MRKPQSSPTQPPRGGGIANGAGGIDMSAAVDAHAFGLEEGALALDLAAGIASAESAEGEIRSQVNDGPARTYKAGESFSELPGDRHRVSANASETQPAKLLAVFVVDTAETELTLPLER